MSLHHLEPSPLGLLERQSFHAGLIVAVTCIGAFIGQLDASIVQLALPRLGEAFGAGVHQVRWVAIAYLLAFAASLGVFGRACDLLGRKLLYLAGFALFALASLLCGWAQDLETLVALRAVQGVGGGLLGANSMAILVRSVPAERRSRAIGLFTAAQAIGVSLGPIAGGLLLDLLDWRWIFWAAVPFGAAAFVLGWAVLPRSGPPPQDRRFDMPGAMLLVPALLLAVLALNQVSVWPPASPAMIACVTGAILCLGLFVWRESRAPSPLIDLALFRSRAFAAGIVGVALGYALLYGMLFVMAFALQKGLANSAAIAGLKLAVIPATLGVVAPLAAGWGERWSPRAVTATGMTLCLAAAVCLILLAFGPDRLVPRLVLPALFGAGLGLFMATNSHATIDAAPAHHTTIAGGLVNLARVLGSCIGISATSSLMAWRLQEANAPAAMGPDFIAAVGDSLLVLVTFAVAALLALRLRTPPRSAAASREA